MIVPVGIDLLDAPSATWLRDVVEAVQEEDQLVLGEPCLTRSAGNPVEGEKLIRNPARQWSAARCPRAEIHNNRNRLIFIILRAVKKLACKLKQQGGLAHTWIAHDQESSADSVEFLGDRLF
jgi:hypothetical protein